MKCPIYLFAQSFKMGSIIHTSVFHILLWNELLIENAAFAAASNAAIFQHTWIPENYSSIDVGVSFDFTKLTTLHNFHNTRHLSTLHLVSSKGSVCCTCFRPALIPTVHRLCFKVQKKVLGFSERAINHCTIRKRFLGSYNQLGIRWVYLNIVQIPFTETPAEFATAHGVLWKKLKIKFGALLSFKRFRLSQAA